MYHPNRMPTTAGQFPTTDRPSPLHDHHQPSPPPPPRASRARPPLVREKSEPALFSRRNSILPLRSRSSSVSSSKGAANTSRTATMTSQPSSDSLSKMAEFSELERPQSRARVLWGKGAKLSRQSSKLSIASLAAMAQEEDQRADSRLRLRMGRKRDSVYETEARHMRLKASISTPFDFQHLAHTQREQLPALKTSNEHELLAEFSTIRASQAPRRELNGIRCDDLQFRNFSMPALDEDQPATTPVDEPAVPTLWPAQRKERSRNRAPPPALRTSRSHENFSQPRHGRQPSVPITPPPRASSRAAFTQTSPKPSPPAPSPKSAPLRATPPSHLEDTLPIPEMPECPKTAPLVSNGFLEIDAAIHAVTTPDETAVPAMNSPERDFSRTNSHDVIEKVPTSSSLSPRYQEESPTFRGLTNISTNTSSTRSSQNTSQFSFGGPRSPHKRSFSRQSDTLGSPFHSPFTGRRGSHGPSFILSPSRNAPPSARGLFSSWEDDIDWCYEHQADADFDFEWGSSPNDEPAEYSTMNPRRNSFELERPSLTIDEGQPRPSTSMDTRAEEDYLQTRFFPGAFRPSLLIPVPPEIPEVPDLAPTTAASASTARTSMTMSLRTPKDLEISIPPRMPAVRDPLASPTGPSEPEFSLTPSLLVPQDYKNAMATAQMYEQMLDDFEPSEQQFLVLDGVPSNRSSNRSSHTHLSKNSSIYDTTSVDSTSSPIRHSDSSSSSLPELVHSQPRVSRKPSDLHIESRPSPTGIKQDAVGRQSAASSYYEDDSDTERASSAATARTFFAADDESHSPINFDQPPASPNPSMLHHERASSEGAAKMLGMASHDRKASTTAAASAPRQRSRASSTGARRASRAGHLSLFPAASRPPRPVYS